MATSNVIPLSASQPSATTILTQNARPLNPSALASLAMSLGSKFTQYESDRKLAEQKWMKNARQYLGIYDPEIDASIDRNRSRAYPKLTRVKCVSMLSRLMNLLFQAGDKNWGIAPTAVPNLTMDDLQPILDQMFPQGSDEAQMPSDDKIEEAIRTFAQTRADRLEIEIEDQLQELGGNKAQDYVALCRKVLASGIQYGAGVLRGPFVHEMNMRKWQVANGRLTAVEYVAMRPRFEFVPLWDYYPDMAAKCFDQMDGQFLRQVMSRAQVLALKQRADFIAPQVDAVLRQCPSGNYKRKTFETDLRSMGAQMNTPSTESGKYEAIVWEGFVQGRVLSDAGGDVPDGKLDDAVRAQVWMIDGLVIKAAMDPWASVTPPDQVMRQYHHFIFEEDESFLLGNGLPNIMRDSQMGLNAAVRMCLDNASVQRVFEVNTALLNIRQDITSINPDMLIYRDDDNPATANVPAVRAVELPMAIDKMQSLATMFQGFADQETFVNPATGGDMQKGPSEPFRTAAGASMLRGDAALPFKDVVRNFDTFTESVIGALILFNYVFNQNPNVKGDFAALAKGATTLIAKEVQGIQLDSLAATLTEDEKRYLNPRGLLRARVKVRDMDVDGVVYDDAKCDEIDARAAQTAQEQAEQLRKTTEANIRKTLSDTLKNLAQANKNAAGAEAQIANVILQALEKGLNPDMLANTEGGPSDGQPNAAGAGAGAQPAGAGAEQQLGAGLAGLEAATGAAVAAPGPRAAAMPAG